MKISKPLQVRLLVVICFSVFASSCAHPDPNVRRGRVGGAAIGAGLGALLSSGSGGLSSGEGAIAGALLGGLLGDAHGKSKSRQY